MRIFKLSSVDAELRAKFIEAQKALTQARAKGDKAAIKVFTDYIKQLMRDECEDVSFLGKKDEKPVKNPGSRSPAFGRFDRDTTEQW